MTYEIIQQPSPRDSALPWDQAGPGLYDDGEVLVRVGDIVATVSFEIHWLENGAGVHIKGTARWCEEDGCSHLCPNGKHIETFCSLNVNPMQLQTYGVKAFTKEVMLGLLGQEPALLREQPEEDGPPTMVPVVQFSEEGRLNMSIVHAAATVQSVREIASSMSLLS